MVEVKLTGIIAE